MSNWEENIRQVVPYIPGEQPKEANIIKLNTNENPYPPAPGVAEAMRVYDADRLRLYPDPTAERLVNAIAKEYAVKPSQVFVGVGSDDVLAMAFMTFFNSKKPILFPDITYSFYDVWADVFRIPYEVQPLDDRLHIIADDYKKENGGIIFPNPNAPTGVLLSLDTVEEIIKSNPDVVVIVDEAYIDFGGVSALPLIQKYENLLVVQTYSKSRSMAGMRIGYAFGSEKLIRYLNDVKYSFNSYTMDALTLVMGEASMQDGKYFHETTKRIIRTRERVKKELADMGFLFEDSMSNFVFVTHPDIEAKQLFEDLKQAGIYVRYFAKPERINHYLRITIGTEEEMNTLLQFLQNYIEKK